MRRIILTLILTGFCPLLSAQDEWAGVWRVLTFNESQPDSALTFYIQTEGGNPEVTIFPEPARPMTIQELEFNLQRNSLRIQVSQSEKQPLPLVFNLKREGDRVSGDWSFSHMQFGTSVSGSLEGLKVFDAPYWQPWLDTEVRRPERFIDLASLLAAESPRNSFEDFQSFWDEQIEPNYYFFLHVWTYGRQSDALAHKRERLETLFKLLQDESIRGRLSTLGPMAERVVRMAETMNRSSEGPGFFLVSFPGVDADYEELRWSRIPTPEEEASCACKLDLRERFIFLNPLEFPSEGSGPILRQKKTMERVMWAEAHSDLATRIFRQALLLQLALEDHGVQWQVSSPGESAARIEFAGLLERRDGRMQLDPVKEQTLAASLSYTLGLAVVRELRKTYSPTELLRFQQREILANFRAYLSEGS